MRVYVVTKWPLKEISRFVCWNITRVSLWVMCKVNSCKVRKGYLPQPLPRDLADLKARIITAVRNIGAPMLTRAWQCRVTRGAHIEHL
jgi:hypothetical protein